jgi:hypothetical protein
MMDIVLYVCPVDVCPDYYGFNGVDLDKPAYARTEDRHAIAKETGGGIQETPMGTVVATDPVVSRHSRAACPTCRAAGRPTSERVKVEISLDKSDLSAVPAEAA